MQKLNEKIRMLREAKSWSQEEMANKLGMSTNGYAKLERGETRLYLSKIERIADVFDVDILELMSLGEKNVIWYNQESNNSNFNIIGGNQELEAELSLLKQSLLYKDEIIRHKDEIINMQKRENEMLRSFLNKESSTL